MRFGVISLALASALAMALFAGGTVAGTTPDLDADGVFDLVDNCVDHGNGTTDSANPVHTAAAVTDTKVGNQQDTDRDGFGNKCDSDYDNSGVVNNVDFGLFFSCFIQQPLAADATFNNAVPPQSCRLHDHDDSNAVNNVDFGIFFADLVNPTHGIGPSALPCAELAPAAPNMTGRHPCFFDHVPNL